MPKQPVFGDILLAARRAQGLTQDDLANRSGVASRLISTLERGHSSPTYRTILLLTAGLGAQLVIGFKTADSEAPAPASDLDHPQSTRA